MVTSAHAKVWVEHGPNTFLFEMAKIAVFTLTGFVVMTVIRRRFDIDKVMKYLPKITLVIVLMMFATLLFADEKGAKAWIRIPGLMTIQPVEFLKIVMILFLADHFGRHYGTDVKPMAVLRAPILFVGGAFIFVTVLQNDLGSALTLLIIALCVFLAVPEKKYTQAKIIILVIMGVTILLFYVLGPILSEWVYSLPNDFPKKSQLLRLAVLFDPLHDTYGSGYQVTNALASLSNSGLFGHGLGNSETKMLLPEVYNDAIIAVIAEETGLVGIFFVFGLYFYIINRLLSFALFKGVAIKDKLVLIGIASFFMAQFFVNIGGMAGVIPMTGVTLLFISSGGSSILTAFMTIGIAQGVIKRYIK